MLYFDICTPSLFFPSLLCGGNFKTKCAKNLRHHKYLGPCSCMSLSFQKNEDFWRDLRKEIQNAKGGGSDSKNLNEQGSTEVLSKESLNIFVKSLSKNGQGTQKTKHSIVSNVRLHVVIVNTGYKIV